MPLSSSVLLLFALYAATIASNGECTLGMSLALILCPHFTGHVEKT